EKISVFEKEKLEKAFLDYRKTVSQQKIEELSTYVESMLFDSNYVEEVEQKKKNRTVELRLKKELFHKVKAHSSREKELFLAKQNVLEQTEEKMDKEKNEIASLERSISSKFEKLKLLNFLTV